MSDEQSPSLPPAGWYPDPERAGQERYWDGSIWSEERREAARQPPPPVQAPQAATPQTVYVERAGNGFAVVALICGIIGAVIGLIPILGVIAIALGLVALVFGILGWRRASDPAFGRKGMAIAGTVLGVLALALGIAGVAVVEDAADDLDRDLEQLERDLNAPP